MSRRLERAGCHDRSGARKIGRVPRPRTRTGKNGTRQPSPLHTGPAALLSTGLLYDSMFRTCGGATRMDRPKGGCDQPIRCFSRRSLPKPKVANLPK